jgi:hypothetical protein
MDKIDDLPEINALHRDIMSCLSQESFGSMLYHFSKLFIRVEDKTKTRKELKGLYDDVCGFLNNPDAVMTLELFDKIKANEDEGKYLLDKRRRFSDTYKIETYSFMYKGKKTLLYPFITEIKFRIYRELGHVENSLSETEDNW